MSTRSAICYRNAFGNIVTNYCHYDGYLENNGVLLFKHYNNSNKVNRLIFGGENGNAISGIEDSGKAVYMVYEDSIMYFENEGKLLDYYIDSPCEFLYLFDEKTQEWWYTTDFKNMNPLRVSLEKRCLIAPTL